MRKPALSSARIGTIHTLLCFNDGVSIVINQIINSLRTYLDIPSENFAFACGKHEGDLYNQVWIDDSLWHKDDTAAYFTIGHFNGKNLIRSFIEDRPHMNNTKEGVR